MNSAGHIKNILLLLTEPIILRYCTWKNYKELLWHKLTIACGEEKDQDAGDQEALRNPIIVFGAVKVDLQFISDEYL
jgi:hypothetical protein